MPTDIAQVTGRDDGDGQPHEDRPRALQGAGTHFIMVQLLSDNEAQHLKLIGNLRLHPTEPFFCFAPEQAGDMEIAPGKPYVSRYRFIVADGLLDQTELERLWNDYAHSPTVRID